MTAEAILWSNAAEEADDQAFSKRIAEKLMEHYPGHLWATAVDRLRGVVHIQALNIITTHGSKLKLTDLYSDPGLRIVVKEGGEILERANQPRGAFDEDIFNNAPRLFTGELVTDNGRSGS